MKPVVELASGKVRGTIEGPLSVFRGIPFACPPVGPLRFGPPQPVEPWAGVREARVFGPAPAQSAIDVEYVPGFSLWEGIGATSEDCLTLNVWTPGLTGRPAYDLTTRPTMLLGETCEVAADPMATERAAWEGLPTA
jgi:carboxylesterase type B